MKRVRCPKCDQPVTFDETLSADNPRIVLHCQHCGKEFAIRMKSSQPNPQQEKAQDSTQQSDTPSMEFGYLTVIENVFHYKQTIPLQLGENKIGRYQKGNPINCPIATDDPSVDLLHCIVIVSYDKNMRLKYELKDGPSNTGTFVDNEILGNKERRIIDNGQMFTIGATSILLRAGQC